jgi:hypothetical protein
MRPFKEGAEESSLEDRGVFLVGMVVGRLRVGINQKERKKAGVFLRLSV